MGNQDFFNCPLFTNIWIWNIFLTIIYFIFQSQSINPIIIILLMDFVMTLIELIGELISLKIKQDYGIIEIDG